MTPPPPSSPPIPKPRLRYSKNSRSSTFSLDRDGADEDLDHDLSNGQHLSTGEDVLPLSAPTAPNRDVFPTLSNITDIISTNIPSLARVAAAIGGSTPSAPPPVDNLAEGVSAIGGSTPSAPPPVDNLAEGVSAIGGSTPSAPPLVDNLAESVSISIPGLAEAVKTVANPAAVSSALSTPAAHSGVPTLDSIIGSMANMPSLAGICNSVANFAVSSAPSAPPISTAEPSRDTPTDVGALSQLVTQLLDMTTGVQLPPAESTETVPSSSPGGPKEEDPYVTVLSCLSSPEEVDTESSNEEEDPGASPALSGSDGDSCSDSAATRILTNHTGPLIPMRPAPPPPYKKNQSVKQKTPRAATIRVSRKKGRSGGSAPQSAVFRASWLDVWKGFRHSVLWATLDGQLMSLRKKRSDRFSEILFHVSSITNVKPQDKGRFSVYFRRKHYDFMAHSDEVREGWLQSLLATRGLQSPASPELHGQVYVKDTRNRAYAAVWGHDLWIYPNKDSFLQGIASFSVPLSVATVKSKGKQSFTLITPYRTFNLSVDSSKDLSTWMDSLSSTIQSALSCSQVALRLWENPYNKVCGDCGAPNPEWASVNLLLVICHSCAGQHRALGSNLSKVRSLRMDSKTWTEPLMQLFVTYGNQLANQVWAPAVPATEQLHPESTDEQRSKFIQDKYSRGRYRRVHALTSSRAMMNQRLCQVVVSDDVVETMSLICSGAKVCPSDPQSPSAILLAEKANQALQIELLRLNEYTEVPPYQPQSANRRTDSASSAEEDEELHGKLEEDRFLFSVENDSAACDVLDLREVLSVFLKDGPNNQFQLVTLSDQLICEADDKETLQTHLLYILKVILPGDVSHAEVGGASAVSKAFQVGGALNQSDVWLLLWEDGVSIHPINRNTQTPMSFKLSMLHHHEMHSSANIISMETADRRISLRFQEQHSCETWFKHLERALANQDSLCLQQCTPAANQSSVLYPVIDSVLRGSVPAAIERCISHITTYGLKVEGVYRRCGLVTKVKKLVEALMTSPNSAPLENDEQGVLDASSALKQFIRDKQSLIPDADREQWRQAAVISDERSRFKEYRRLLRKLPDDNRATLNALFGHFYMIQVFSQVNKMSAHNLAVVLVPSLFQAMSQDLIGLMREFIIHHTLLFLTPGEPREEEEEEEEEEITVL